jgi:hypothetical protein
MVSSDVVEVVVVWGRSEAQPDRAPITEARMQESKSFFMIQILSKARGAPAYASKRTDTPKLGSCRGRRLSHDDFVGDHFIAILRVINGHRSTRFHRFTRDGITVFIDVGCRL